LLRRDIPFSLRDAVFKTFAPVFLVLSLAVSARAQTVDDGVMVAERSLLTGDIYAYETWDQY
jgi:hypothetical protein